MTTAADHDEAPGPAVRVEVRPRGRGRPEVCVKIGDTTVARDTCDPANARSRTACLKSLREQTQVIDDAVAAEIERKLLDLPPDAPTGSGGLQGQPVAYETVAPWPEPVNGSALLDDIVSTLHRLVVLPEHAPAAVALWVLHAWCFERFVHSPRLALSSPTMRCGKTVLLRLLGFLTPRPQPIDNGSPATLFRLIDSFAPTLLLDETDRWMRDPDNCGALIGVVNSGHSRGGTVPRCVGESHEVRLFRVFAPMALAGIGSQAGTIRDRAIELPMRRKAPGERVERLREDRLNKELEPLRRRAARWVADHGEALAEADPGLPEALSDRAQDNWRPLCAIADRAGGAWPERARAAALSLSGGVDADDGLGVLLLADLRDVFDRLTAEKLATAEIIRALAALEERPWSTLERGKEITPRAMARILKPFRLKSRNVKLADGSTPKGYRREDCAAAFNAYLPPPESATPPPAAYQADPGPNASATGAAVVADANARGSACHAGSGGVADPPGGLPEEVLF